MNYDMEDTQNSAPGSLPSAQASKLAAPRKGPDAQSTTKRLQTELMQLMTSSAPGISAFPSADGNLLSWTATIEGPDETPYADLTFKLSASPLNGEAAELWDKDPEEFKRKVLGRHQDVDDE
ncbi:putative Ubiquitin-conjugating enzyme E2-20 kDa [Glarea lozoyensis 74030]|uniref:Putative Ubiquitin-conjugating enzyme E2-20 kDa n=1 Tax=Glarea lozoyensis (strain ATCC 74030 / MF5533) TaxID=1104152 RepID=H0EH35_GLAL7|nr:putative Ubiquitin-conjugating enzyme E2-20 kDa [Glarea lozoyensis 74030]